MANSTDNINEYATNFISFDEVGGSAYDKIGGYIGTFSNNPTRVDGWNGNGFAMNFSGANQYITFNNPIIPIGAKSIRFKIKTTQTTTGIIMSQTLGTTRNGTQISISNGNISFLIGKSVSGSPIFDVISNKKINDGQWHDVLFVWDGTTNINSVEIYIDDMLIPDVTGTSSGLETLAPSNNLRIGTNNSSPLNSPLNGQLDQIEIYDRVISHVSDKYLVLHDNQYKYHDTVAWQITNNTEENFIRYGMSNLDFITEQQWLELSGEKSLLMWSDFENKKYAHAVLNVNEYSAYDLIGENPEIIIHTDSTDDIIISTTTEPYSIYDQLNDEIEVLNYTNDNSVTTSDLILEANFTPIDELEGDLEIVTLTETNIQPSLDISSVPKPQFVYKANLTSIDDLENVIVSDLSTYYRNDSPVKVLFSQNNVDWYYFNGIEFTRLSSLTVDNIKNFGNSVSILNTLTTNQFNNWAFDKINVGIYLEDDIKNTVISKTTDVGIVSYLPNNTSIVEDSSFYVLNTTARIDIDLQGNSIFGTLSDADMTRVQYRVKLNGQPYFPINGEFTALSSPPQSISINFNSDEIKIDDWNDVDVEFQDFFGTTDTWSTRFVGKYAGLLFSDENGDLYSNDVGKVLKYLDFGTVLTGQTTPVYTINLKNEYGFDVKDVNIRANTSEFAEGLELDLSLDSALTDFSDSLTVSNMANAEEIPFYLRMRSPITTIPNGHNLFDIFVSAKRDV